MRPLTLSFDLDLTVPADRTFMQKLLDWYADDVPRPPIEPPVEPPTEPPVIPPVEPPVEPPIEPPIEPEPPVDPPTAPVYTFIEDWSTRVAIPDDFTAGIPWTAANQPDAESTIVDTPDGKKALQLSIVDARNSVGARVFWHPFSPRWDTFAAWMGKTMTIRYKLFIPEPMTIEQGAGKWMTLGVQIKDDSSQGAIVQTNVETVNGQLVAILGKRGQPSVKRADFPPYRIGEWMELTLAVKLAADASGWARLTFDGVSLEMPGATCGIGGGGAWSMTLYSNALDSARVLVGVIGVVVE